MNRNEVIREIRERVGAHLQIHTRSITVHWEQAGDRPKVRIPTRLDNIGEDFDWSRVEAIVAQVMEGYEAPDIAELSDTDYASRMQARRKK